MRTRPLVILLGLAAAVLVAAALVVLMSERQRFAAVQAEIQTLQNRVRTLSYNTASGGGVNVKMMPDPATGNATVPLEEVFSFDRNHAMCRVDTNPRAFKMPTHKMGEVVIQPNQFQTKVKIGSRTAKEHATYLIEAVDGGGGGGKAGDSFAFTVFFDEKEAPVNYAIFGPKATFTGQMIEGEITIVDPTK